MRARRSTCATAFGRTSTPGRDAPGYTIAGGKVTVPDMPGFGLMLDDDVFRQAVSQRGGHVRVL